MLIHDRIYGDIHITDPLIIDLLASAPLERLKGISQDGATHFIQPFWNATRFEHSLGAWYLAERFKRPIEEQVACLLHDVPHTAFSHVVDFLMEDHNQEYHDRFLNQVVLASDIPDICKKHGIDVHAVLQKGAFNLLDNRTPELSFDRWDYFMRDAHILGILPAQTVELILASARLQDDRFYFEDVNVASQLCLTSLMTSQLGYVSATSHGSYFLLVGALKVALREGIITETDLFKTDQVVWDALVAAGHPEITAYLDRLRPGREFIYAPKEDAEFYGKNKVRYIDPLVLKGNELRRTSEIIPGLEQYIGAFKKRCDYIGVRQIND